MNVKIGETRDNFRVFFRVAVVGVVFGALDPGAFAQLQDSFERADVSWRLQKTDDPLIQRTFKQKISARQKRSGEFSEHFRFESNGLKRAWFGLDVDPVAAIPELIPSIWANSPQADVQLVARVVLPYSRVPGSDQPVTVLVEGPILKRKNAWQKLSFQVKQKDIDRRLQEKIWMLRERFKDSDINARSAYVDLLMVLAITQRGVNEIWIDDLKMDGIVSAAAIAKQVERNGAIVPGNLIKTTQFQEAQKPQSLFVRNGSVIEYRGQPYAIRSIQHNGESFEQLRTLGFNTIELREPATKQQLAEAKRLSLWLIAPPPQHIGLYKLDSGHDQVLAWMVGKNLGGKDVVDVQQTIREIGESETRSQRPVILDVQSNWSTYGRLGSAISISHEPIGSSMELRKYSDWIARWRKKTGNLPFLVGVQTELPENLMHQVSAITGHVPPSPISAAQMQYAMYEAIAGGARGIRFLSRSRLDAGDPSSRLRVATLRWLTQQLIELEPWIAGGAVMEPLNTQVADLEATQIKTSRTRLILVQKSTGWEQWFAGDAVVSGNSFVDTHSVIADHAYRLSDQGLLPKSESGSAGGLKIDFSGTGICSAFIVTQSPIAVNRLSRSFALMNRQARNELRIQLTQNWLAIEQLLARQNAEAGGAGISVQAPLDQAGVFVRQAEQLISGQSSLMAMQYLSRADHQLALSRRELVLSARRGFPSRMASPLVAHCTLIPAHWRLGRQLGQGNWQPNGLAGGDFENLQHMQQNGWQNQRSDNDAVQTHVELSADAAVGGRFGLRMSASARDNHRPIDLVEATPVWINTGDVPVKSGQLVRIHGWIRIDQPIQGSPDGFMITDSLGAVALAERIHVTNQWQEFTLYRAASQNSKINIRFALTGLGTVMLDEVTIRTFDLPLPEREANQATPNRSPSRN